jgi:hypothetical protein
MKAEIYEGIVENGCVHLPPEVHVPDKSTVYMIIPGSKRTARILSPRLANPEQASHFKLEVTKEETDA